MPKADPETKKTIGAFMKKKKTGAKKLGKKVVKQRAHKAVATAKWSEKQAPPVEKKAFAELESVVEEVCVEEQMEEVGMMLEQAKPPKAAIKPKMAALAKAKKRVKKVAEALPPPAAKAVEKELNSAFDSAMKFWKDLEAEAKKEGIGG